MTQRNAFQIKSKYNNVYFFFVETVSVISIKILWSFCQQEFFNPSICQSVKRDGEAGVHGMCMLFWIEKCIFFDVKISYIFSSVDFHSISSSDSDSSCFFTSDTVLLAIPWVFLDDSLRFLEIPWTNHCITCKEIKKSPHPIGPFLSPQPRKFSHTWVHTNLEIWITFLFWLGFRWLIHHSKALLMLFRSECYLCRKNEIKNLSLFCLCLLSFTFFSLFLSSICQSVNPSISDLQFFIYKCNHCLFFFY